MRGLDFGTDADFQDQSFHFSNMERSDVINSNC